MKKPILLFFLLIYGITWYVSFHRYQFQLAHPVVLDVAGLLPTKVKEIKHGETKEQLQQWVKQAHKHGEKISIAGMQHSQGGQTYYPGAIMIDMKQYNKILQYDPKAKRITVQSGATWADIQKKINPDGLALEVTQSQNIFTIGGSMSVNVHGRDIRYGSLIDTIESFRLLQADGSIIQVSRTEHPKLFSLVIGGYGLFGIILDVTLQLTENELYQNETVQMNYREYSNYFRQHVQSNPNVRMHIARISVAPNHFFTEMYATNYHLASNQNQIGEFQKLKNRDQIVALPKFFLDLARYSDGGKNIFWTVQKNLLLKQSGSYETRNNVMRAATDFMEYENPSRTEILQEYFVPVDEFAPYIDDIRKVLTKEELNVINITVRYVGKDQQSVMSYAKEDMFALVWLINQKKSADGMAQTEKVLRKLIKVTLKHRGSYYLPYYSYPSQQELENAYPRSKEFFQKKRLYDPDDVFMNFFYKEYGQ
ncbi:FAD-binding oxidoreductase [Bacillus sp. UNC438CL73TsuS30]|uniref:FAD-binding oxidoreductase n=1 Tax=Bacillus sp. UNC438CL73TsuS30 TaxID=1340434 RepID=UPI00047D602A|nr:FAD-binding oxidoreductase [Bacillus sp. UNC438CL73TsuS30]